MHAAAPGSALGQFQIVISTVDAVLEIGGRPDRNVMLSQLYRITLLCHLLRIAGRKRIVIADMDGI